MARLVFAQPSSCSNTSIRFFRACVVHVHKMETLLHVTGSSSRAIELCPPGNGQRSCCGLRLHTHYRSSLIVESPPSKVLFHLQSAGGTKVAVAMGTGRP